jgi:hypothetical protein
VGREKEDGLERVPELQVRNYIYKRVLCERVKGDLGASGDGKALLSGGSCLAHTCRAD